MCVCNDPNAAEFAQWLLALGEGCNFQAGASDIIAFPPHMKVASLQELFNSIYPNLETLEVNNLDELSAYFKEHTILCPKNDGALQLNEKLLDKFPGVFETFQSVDTALVEWGADLEQANRPLEYLNSLICSGLPPSA